MGTTLSPFKSYRYWQVEFLNSLHSYSSEITVQDAITTTPNGVRQLRTTTETSNENINWEVPVLLRYNINNYIGVGVGLQANIKCQTKYKRKNRNYRALPINF
jgi:hypothetical protein